MATDFTYNYQRVSLIYLQIITENLKKTERHKLLSAQVMSAKLSGAHLLSDVSLHISTKKFLKV